MKYDVLRIAPENRLTQGIESAHEESQIALGLALAARADNWIRFPLVETIIRLHLILGGSSFTPDEVAQQMGATRHYVLDRKRRAVAKIRPAMQHMLEHAHDEPAHPLFMHWETSSYEGEQVDPFVSKPFCYEKDFVTVAASKTKVRANGHWAIVLKATIIECTPSDRWVTFDEIFSHLTARSCKITPYRLVTNALRDLRKSGKLKATPIELGRYAFLYQRSVSHPAIF